MAASSSVLSFYTLLNIFFFFLLIEKNSLVSASGLAGEYLLIDVESLLPSKSCSMPDKDMSPSKLTLVHQCGPCSPLACEYKLSLEDKNTQIFKQDQARVDYINRMGTNNSVGFNPLGSSLSTIVPIREGIFAGTFNFIVVIYLGTPPMPYFLIFDTGSDLTWTQCIPCEKCYPQINPIYNPFESSTYASIRCYSEYCTQLKKYSCSWAYNCLYKIQYTDGTYTKGYLVQDTLEFSHDIIENFLYGCSVNTNIVHHMSADGIIGFGQGPASIIIQTGQSYDSVFSYCLPSKPSLLGYLTLGNDATNVQYTPMITNQMKPSLYFVNFISISIGGEQLARSPSVFGSSRIKLASGRITMLDTGTMITRLPPTTYYNIRSIFRKYMANYLRTNSWGILDTCYDFTNYPDVDVKVPLIKFQFDGGVIIKLDISGILFGFSRSKQCFAFVANKYDSDEVIIGNVQLRTFNIVHDINNLRIGFGANGCS